MAKRRWAIKERIASCGYRARGYASAVKGHSNQLERSERASDKKQSSLLITLIPRSNFSSLIIALYPGRSRLRTASSPHLSLEVCLNLIPELSPRTYPGNFIREQFQFRLEFQRGSPNYTGHYHRRCRRIARTGGRAAGPITLVQINSSR